MTQKSQISRVSRKFVAMAFITPLVALSPVLQAQDDKTPIDPKTAEDGGLGMPAPFDKFPALDQALSDTRFDWGKTLLQVAVDVDADRFKPRDVAVPMLLGVRLADSVMAVKACDAGSLNKCASDIEKLALKLGVQDSALGRAHAATAAANNNEWSKAFVDLGFLKQDIMKKISDKDHPTRGDLLVVCGWMQGARYTTTILENHYSAAASNILREPLLPEALNEKVRQMPYGVKKNPTVAKMLEVLPRIQTILNVPLDGTISKENVIELNKLSTEVIRKAEQPEP